MAPFEALFIHQTILPQKLPFRWADLRGKEKGSTLQADLRNQIKPVLRCGSKIGSGLLTLLSQMARQHLSHPEIRLLNSLLGDLGGIHRIWSRNQKLLSSDECSHTEHLQRASARACRAPGFSQFTTCCTPVILLHAVQEKGKTTSCTGFGPEFCHLLGCDLEQIPQSECSKRSNAA